MTPSPLHKLNAYRIGAISDEMFIGKMKGMTSIPNFQWVLEGKLARCAQPGYSGSDQQHSVNRHDAYFLTSKNIRRVISVNSRAMHAAGQTALANAGIAFHHFPIPDLKAPTAWELWKAASLIEAGRGAAIVYCGFGAGRTGTVVAAWAKLTQKPKIEGLDDESFLKENFGVEMPCQIKVLNTLYPGMPEPKEERTPNPLAPPAVLTPSPVLAGIGGGKFADFTGGGGSGSTFHIPHISGGPGGPFEF